MDIKLKFPKMNIDFEKFKKYKVEIKDQQLAKLPKEVKFCKECVMSNQRPRIEFDENGVCNACNYAHKKFDGGIDWDKREKELRALLDKHRSKDGSFDCLVPGSGGKDSVVVAHQLKYKYGMHPLTITWAPSIYSSIGFQNYYNWIQSGFDGMVAWPNGILHRKLARVAFELKGDATEPFVYGQKSFVFHMALKFKIPLIFYGENGEVEYGGSSKNEEKPYESIEDWDELYFKGGGVDDLLKEGVKMGIFTEEELKNNNFEFYRPPLKREIEKLGAQMHWFSYYYKWDAMENRDYAMKYTGFEPNPERTVATHTNYCSLDDETELFHWLLGYIKFGYGRCIREACSEIRNGTLTREEAIELAKKYDGEFPKKYLKQFLDYLDMTEEHFWEIIDRYRLPYIWKKEDGKWKLRHPIWEVEKKEN